MRVQCDDCGWTGEVEATEPATEIEKRHALGALYSDLECPQCGSLCYPTDCTKQYPWVPYESTEISAALKLVEQLAAGTIDLDGARTAARNIVVKRVAKEA